MTCDLFSPLATPEIVLHGRMVVRKKYAIVGCTAQMAAAKCSMAQPEFESTLLAGPQVFPPEHEIAAGLCGWAQILKILEEYGLDPAPRPCGILGGE